MNWTGWGVVLVALFAAGANLAFVMKWRSSVKRPLRIFNALAVIYFAFVYTMLTLGYLNLPDHGATLVRPGIGILLLLLAAEPIADWRSRV